jgi:hypothetical protein
MAEKAPKVPNDKQRDLLNSLTHGRAVKVSEVQKGTKTVKVATVATKNGKVVADVKTTASVVEGCTKHGWLDADSGVLTDLGNKARKL